MCVDPDQTAGASVYTVCLDQPVQKLRIIMIYLFKHVAKLGFVSVEVLRPCQQLRSRQTSQLPINTVPGQA